MYTADCLLIGGGGRIRTYDPSKTDTYPKNRLGAIDQLCDPSKKEGLYHSIKLQICVHELFN